MLSTLAPLVVFVGALIAYRRGGTALMVWSDTFNDQNLVDQCLTHDSCTLVGVQTSIRGLFHAVAWLQLRTLAEWIGIRGDDLLWAIQVLNALAVAIVFQVASRVQGILAGSVAAAILVFAIGDLSVPLTGINNLSSLLFMGAVLTLACTAAIRAPGFLSVALAPLVAAVMANVHLICVLLGVSVVAVGLLAPRRRLLMGATAAVVFAVATIAIAAPSWRLDALSLLQGQPGSQATASATWPRTEIVGWAGLAIAAWALSLFARSDDWGRYRRNALGALAIIIPMLAAVLCAPLVGVYTDPKYLTPIRAASAVAAALPIACLLQTALQPLAPTAYHAVAQTLPFIVAAAIALGASLGVPHPELTMAVGDLSRVAQLLHERGWSDQHIVRAFVTAERATALTGVLQLGAQADQQPATDDDGGMAMLLTLPGGALPDPLPPGWHLLRRAGDFATVLVFTNAQVDWSRFEFCVPRSDAGDLRCDAVSMDGFNPLGHEANMLPHMPPAGVRWEGGFRLRLRLLPSAPGTHGAIFMPRGRGCGGRIAAIVGATADISPDNRRATFAVPSDQSDAHIDLEWNVGSPDCGAWAYDGLPPFIVEGEASQVDQLEALLRQSEVSGTQGVAL